MARRYAAILKHLGVSFQGVDLGEKWPEPSSFDSILICTPTHRHVDDIFEAARFRLPILCEKPVSKSLDDALAVCDYAETWSIPLRMVNQYAFLPGDGEESAVTIYDYWNHGKDGLVLDCISVLALAKGRVELREESPLWQCQINGVKHYASEMDYAYIDMIKDWLGGNISDIPYIRVAQAKAAAYMEAHG